MFLLNFFGNFFIEVDKRYRYQNFFYILFIIYCHIPRRTIFECTIGTGYVWEKSGEVTTLRNQFCQINKNIWLVFSQQNSFVVPTKHFAISIKFCYSNKMFCYDNKIFCQDNKESFVGYIFFSV